MSLEERNRVVSINLGEQSHQAISGQENGQTDQNQVQTTPQAS